MNWKKWLLGFAVLVVIVQLNDFFCGDEPPKKKVESTSEATEPETTSPVEVPRVNPLDTSLMYSVYVSDYIPSIVSSEEDLREYVEDYTEFCDDYYSSLDDKLETMSKLAGIQTEAEEGSKDAVDGGKKVLKAWGTLRSGLGSMAATVWDAKDVVRLESKRNELTKKYASGVLETVWSVEQYLNNYAYYSYVEFFADQSEKIKQYTSLWSQPSAFTADYIEELGFDKSINLLMAVRKDAARARKILIYNQMKGVESKYLESEIAVLQTFWSGEEAEFESDAKLFKPISRSLSRLKADLVEKENTLEEKSALWNENAIQEMKTQLSRVHDIVEADIERLNVYDLPNTDWALIHE